MSKKINIDIFRFILSFLIIAIHISPFAKISLEFDFFFTRILGRIAVPLFLMITGYYILDKSLDDISILKTYTNKILKIYLFCIILYIPMNIYIGKFSTIDFIQIIKDIFINGTQYHLWYFPALILGLWITYFLIKRLGNKKTFFITLIFYIIGLFGDSYYEVASMFEISRAFYDLIFNICNYTRNGLFLVPILLYLGYIVKTSKKTQEYDLYLSGLFFLCMMMEAEILHHFNLQRHDSMYIFLLPIIYFLFRYLIGQSKSINKKLRELSTGIYIFHPLFIVIVRLISRTLGVEKIFIQNNLVLYITVSLGTLIFCVLLGKIKEVTINEIRNKNKQIID